MSGDKLEGAAYPAAPAHDRAPLVGGFSYDAGHDRWTWTPEVFRIHGFEQHDVVPTSKLIGFHAVPDDREAVAEVLARAAAQPGRFHLTYRLTDAHGVARRVLLLGASRVAADGAIQIRGQIVDLTSLQDEILNDDLGPMVEDFREHRAVIEQAKGVVIQLYSVDADEAFDRIRACSQALNVKVREIAQYLVLAAAQDQTPGKNENFLNLLEIVDALLAANDGEGYEHG